ncbi:MAG: type II toxin-antitoxin system Phd/YefM family antitoxin [Gammaproteobacteria bacterium]
MSSSTRSIQSGVFKAKCLQLMDEVKEKHIDIIITKHGKPVAKLVPLDDEPKLDLFGCMKNTIIVKGDIVSPTNIDWEENE